MDAEKKPNAQELTEQELEQVLGAGEQGDWVCPECGSTEYRTMVYREIVHSLGRSVRHPFYKCSQCGHTENI